MIILQPVVLVDVQIGAVIVQQIVVVVIVLMIVVVQEIVVEQIHFFDVKMWLPIVRE
jgi:hypothetical protein